jgi:hypothetical protein
VKELAAVLVTLNSTVAKYVLPPHSLFLCLTTSMLTSCLATVPRIPLRSSPRASRPI